MKTKEWNPLTAMPVVAYCITAALWNNTIILSGYELSCLYSYDGSSFLSVLDLSANTFKVVFDGWVLNATTLFETSKNNVAKWTGINVNPQWAENWIT